MRLRHRTVIAGSAALLLLPATAARAADRVLPHAGVLYIGSALEDGVSAGAISVRIGPTGSTLVSLLGGHFHGDQCTGDPAMFAGPGGIDPLAVSISSDGRFFGTQVTAAPDGARVASTLRGRFSANAATASGSLTFAMTPISGAMPCTMTAAIALHTAPATPIGKVTPPRTSATYHAVTHQGWPATLTLRAAAPHVLTVGAWDVCHYREQPAVHFLYPEHLAVRVSVAHGRFTAHVASTGGSGHVDATLNGQFVGVAHHLTGALHVRRTGTNDGNAFVCDTQRVLFSAP